MNKIFYGEIFMEQEKLKHNGIYHPIKIDYYKTEETNEILENETLVKYGIEIIKTEYKDEDTNVEVNKINAICNEEKEIDEILRMFKENEVTPVIAEDIIDDYFFSLNKN